MSAKCEDADNGVKEEDDDKGPATKKKRNLDSESDLSKKEFTLMNVLETIMNVKSWKDLGLQLKITLGKLNNIQENLHTEEERKIEMIKEWMKMEGANWDSLHDALISPALCENTTAYALAKRRGSSFDSKSVRHSQSVASSCSEGEFTVANVRNEIEHFPYLDELGEKLGIPSGKRAEIASLTPEKRKFMFVDMLFRVDHECNWIRFKAAMKDAEVLAWTKKHSWQKSGSGSLGSYSEDMFSPTHSSNASSLSEIDYAELQANKAANKKNMATIRTNYLKLLKKITHNLGKVDIDMSWFHSFIIGIFEAEDLPKAETVKDAFDILTQKKCWNFLTVYHLESIVQEFSEQYEEQNKKLIKEYKEELAGFKTAVKIIDYMANSTTENESEKDDEYNSIASEKAKYDEAYRKQLSIKLHEGKKGGAKITFRSLEYVDRLWESLCDEFEMPSLPKLLDSITFGSIIITWLVRRINAQKILSQISYHVEFLKQEMVIEISLENVIIYNENSGVSTAEVINYTKLVMMQQEGKLRENIDILKRYFPDINATINQDGRCLLTMAAQCGHRGMVEFLLDHGADAFLIDAGGKGVLHVSAAHEGLHNWLKITLDDRMISSAKDGDLAAVNRALAYGISPDAKENDDFAWTALLWASDKGHIDVVNTLLQYGADPNAHDRSCWTSLILATRKGHFEIVKKLLDNKADPNKMTGAHWTPLMFTIEGNHPEITKLLLERGANPHLYDRAGLSPLYQAAQDGRLDIVKVLVENYKDLEINHTTEMDWSALAVTVMNGHEDVARYLVEKGADVAYEKKDQSNVLHIASSYGHTSIARFLVLQNRDNVNKQDMDGLTPLMFASHQGEMSLVRTLVENGRANLDIAENRNNWNALFFAMEAKHQEVFEYLLNTHRIDMTHKDVKGNTIFDLAEQVNKDAFTYLQKNFKQDMVKVERERIESGESKPTVKTMMETGEMYFVAMLQNMRAKGPAVPLKAGAGAA